jgi:hypothetical protein
MARYAVKIESTSLFGGSGTSTRYKDASNTAELNKVIKDAKDSVTAFRISVNGKVAYESKGSGAKKKWYKK